VADERRRQERRTKERRKPPSASIDVTRLEHENLYEQVEQILRSLRRIEHELRELDRRVRPENSR
jgi:hypothetical protein